AAGRRAGLRGGASAGKVWVGAAASLALAAFRISIALGSSSGLVGSRTTGPWAAAGFAGAGRGAGCCACVKPGAAHSRLPSATANETFCQGMAVASLTAWNYRPKLVIRLCKIGRQVGSPIFDRAEFA